jgi:mono/diheme cytochrome c family protein
MRKTIALAVIFFAAILVIGVNSCNNASDIQTTATQDSLRQMVARGQYLATHVAVCIHCHSQRDFTKYSGPVVPGTEGGGGQRFDSSELSAIPGILYSPNITPDSATGIGTWTDAELVRAITQGINKKGDTLFPLMPYASFNRMAKSDVLSIIAYLRTLKPISNKVPPRQLLIPISMAYPAPALQKSIDSNVCPPATDKVNYGRYLITIAGCGDCHTPFVKGRPDFSKVFAGGNTFHLAEFSVTSANITPDSTTGIGTWDANAFVGKFSVCRKEEGYNFNAGKRNTIMPIVDYAGMTDGDLKAIFAYLHSVPPVKNLVKKYPE